MKADRLEQYRKLKADADDVQICAVCGEGGLKSWLSPHHPCGRRGNNLFRIVWVHEQPCHRWLHHNVADATKRGLLWRRRNTHTIGDHAWKELLQLMKEGRE